MKGLTKEEVLKRIGNKETNLVKNSADKTIAEIILSNLLTYFNLIFLILLPVVIINLIIGIYQQLKSKKILDKLALLEESNYTVIRDGKEEIISSKELVLNDLVILHSGEQIPADAIVKEGYLSVNESLLTGEMDEIDKIKNSELRSGSFVVSGEAYVELTKVGEESYVAKLSKEAKQIKVDFVTFEPTEEEKIEELNEIIERRVENDLFIHGQAKSFLEQTLLNPQELEKVDPQVLKRVVAVYNIINEELNRIATQQPALFNKTHLDSIASEDVETLLSQVSADKKAQVISELAAVFESSPEQVSAIFGISDPDILKKSVPQKVAEGVFNSLVTVKYVAVTLVQTLRVPVKDISVSEMTQGMIPKLYALAQSFGWNSYIYHDKPAFFVSAFSMSIILDTFHGVEASGWMDFQNRMVQEKGSNFVTVFNMTYDLMIKMMFRTNAFLAGNMPLIGSQEGVINLIWLMMIVTSGLLWLL